MVKYHKTMTRRKKNPNIGIFDEIYNLKKTYGNSKPKCKPLKVNKVKKKRIKSNNKILKDKAWKQFSIYIRTRDCLKTTGTTTRGICYTCGKKFDFKELQAGHCIGGRHNFVLLDEDLVNAQCQICNSTAPWGKKGNYEVSVPKKIKEYGMDWWEEKLRLSRLTMDRNWEEEFGKYQEKYFKLKKTNKLPF